MEFIVSVAGSFLEDLCRLTFTPICDRIRNFFQFKSNLKALEKEMGKLMIRKTDVDREIDVADKEGKSPTAEAKRWVDDVNKIHGEITSLEGGGMEDSSNKVVEMLKVVSQLLKEGEGLAARVAADNHLPVPVEHIPGPSIEDQSTASKNLAKIMDLLSNDEVKRIGICGMGGVGKTTLVQNLNNNLKKNTSSMQSFSIVVWATVSKNFDLKTVQKKLAARFQLTNSEESTEIMAIRLHQRFEKEKSFLLILDDVWTAINLDELGVPRPDVHKGGKIILTSRFTGVCHKMMTDVNFKVDVLDDKESWELFCKNTGAMSEPVEQIAKEVAKKCGGLPLAIITVGKSLRHQENDAVWNDALNSLQRAVPHDSGIEDEVFKPLKWSYESLKDDRTKFCFLCCCFYSEDFSIDVIKLIRFWFAEGLLDEHQSYEEQENRGMAIIESLKDSCLLDRGDREDTVKMHDVVRDVAIWIASSMEDGSKSFIRSGIGLRQFPNNDSLKSFRRLSFMNNEITRLPDCVMECPKASTLLLQDNEVLETVPHRFLEGFPVLRILDLSGTYIKSLPHSLTQLGELRALLLSRCQNLEELPPLEGLRRLQILDCSCTDIKALPEGIEKLVHLRQLDLSHNPNLKTIRAGILSSLSNLESLNMFGIDYKWRMMENVKTGRAPFEELLCLERLVVLSIELRNISLPTSDDFITWIKRLRKFWIEINHYEGFTFRTSLKHDRFSDVFYQDFSRRRTAVTFSSCNELVGKIGVPLIKATSVYIRGVLIDQMFENVDNMDHTVGPFASLKILTINSCKLKFGQGIRRDGAQLYLFPNVEDLCLDAVEFLESISDLADYFGLRFSRLRRLRVRQCPHLKYILSIGGSILSLEKLDVTCCNGLEELFRCCNSMQTSALDPFVPNLRKLYLYNLPSLKTLCRENISLPRLERLHVRDCGLIRRLPLVLENTNTIQEIRGEEEWWDQLEWDGNDDTKQVYSVTSHLFKKLCSACPCDCLCYVPNLV